MKSQLRWAGHVVRMTDDRLPKQLLYGELSSGKRSRGGQKKRFKDSLKSSLKAFEIDWNSWEQMALDRPQWRASVFEGFKSCELNRTSAAILKRKNRKERASTTTAGTIPCPRCNRTFRAQVGLRSHLRAHKPG